ncbi:MAG: type II secretion system F family protein [Methanobrevibacter sp.]|jgi:flagellar protein FlaJ|nr:type II secretion system F family protein [Candidatus Methanoflexus mossambicus]
MKKEYTLKFNEFLDEISKKIENKIPENYLNRIQDELFNAQMSVNASRLIGINLIIILNFTIFSFIISLIFNLNIIITVLFSIISIPLSISIYVMIKKEKRKENVEKATPDFLRQIASMLRIGMGFENAMEELSQLSSGPLHNEVKRAITEIKMGNDFETSILSIPERLKSKDLKRSFQLIIEGRKSGGSLADVIDSVAENLRKTNQLKRERKSTVMMSVMFLIISAVIATPFALGMVGVYSSFLTNLGKNNSLVETGITAASSYIIIHSSLVGLIIGTILYGNFKKGIKFSIPIVIVSYLIFYGISNFGTILLGTF